MDHTKEQIEAAAKAGWLAMGESFSTAPERVTSPWEESGAGHQSRAIHGAQLILLGIPDETLPEAFVAAARTSLGIEPPESAPEEATPLEEPESAQAHEASAAAPEEAPAAPAPAAATEPPEESTKT